MSFCCSTMLMIHEFWQYLQTSSQKLPTSPFNIGGPGTQINVMI